MQTLALDITPRYTGNPLWIDSAAVSGVPAEVVEGYVLQAQGIAEQKAGRPLLWASYRVTVVPGCAREELTLPARPVHALPTGGTYLDARAGICSGPWAPGVAVMLSFDAGYLLPATVTAWASTTARAVDSWLSAGGRLWRCTTAGITGATEPVPTLAADTVADGSVVWSRTHAELLPGHLQTTLGLAAQVLYDRSTRPSDLAAVEIGNYKETYRAQVGDLEKTALLPLSLERALEMYR